MTGWRPGVLPVLFASTIFWFATTCSKPFSTIQIEPTRREAHDMVKVSDQRDFRIHRIVQVLNNDPFRSLPELARNCQISASRLSHLFKDEIGVNVKHYRLDCRLQMAAEILISTDRSIKEIAYSAGYRHCSSFVRAFNTHFGLSPACYRKKKPPRVA